MSQLKNVKKLIGELEQFALAEMSGFILNGDMLRYCAADLTSVIICYLKQAVELDLIELNKNKRNKVEECLESLGCLN